MTNKYEERQQARRDRLESAADTAASAAAKSAKAARAVADRIPFGQPILRGHHSEGRHRRDADRIERGTRRAAELDARAEELRDQAAAVGTGGISSDDPEALVKLRAEMVEVAAAHERGLALNRAFKAEIKARGAGKDSTLERIALHQARLDAIDAACETAAIPPDERAGHRRTIELCSWMTVPYQASSGSSSLRRIEARIEELERERAIPAAAEVRHDDLGLAVIDRPEDNRTALRFDALCSDEAVKILGGEGWRWARSTKTWQRQRNQASRYSLERVLVALRRLLGEAASG